MRGWANTLPKACNFPISDIYKAFHRRQRLHSGIVQWLIVYLSSRNYGMYELHLPPNRGSCFVLF